MPTGKPSAAPTPQTAVPAKASHGGPKMTMIAPTAARVKRREHRHSAVAVEQPRADDPRERHEGEEGREGQHAGPRGELVALDERDGQPVVRGALGEGRREHDDPDEQGARLEPGGLGVAPGRCLGRLAVLGRRAEGSCPGPTRRAAPTRRPRPRSGRERHAAPRLGGADEGREHGATGEGGVEVWHDGRAEQSLDRRALEVHRDVPDADAHAQEEQPHGHEQPRLGEVDASADHEQPGEPQHHAELDRPAAPTRPLIRPRRAAP